MFKIFSNVFQEVLFDREIALEMMGVVDRRSKILLFNKTGNLVITYQ